MRSTASLEHAVLSLWSEGGEAESTSIAGAKRSAANNATRILEIIAVHSSIEYSPWRFNDHFCSVVCSQFVQDGSFAVIKNARQGTTRTMG